MQYLLKRSKRKTLSLELTANGEVLVRAPLRLSKTYIDGFVQDHLDWLEKARARQKKAQEARAQRPALTPYSKAQLEQIRKAAKEALPVRLAYLAEKYGFRYNRIALKFLRSRWGSCSAKGNINLNCLLMLAPAPVIDYVLIHELCHLRHMDHSPAFWALVASIDPDHKAHRKWLKDNGAAIIGRLPD